MRMAEVVDRQDSRRNRFRTPCLDPEDTGDSRNLRHARKGDREDRKVGMVVVSQEGKWDRLVWVDKVSYRDSHHALEQVVVGRRFGFRSDVGCWTGRHRLDDECRTVVGSSADVFHSLADEGEEGSHQAEIRRNHSASCQVQVRPFGRRLGGNRVEAGNVVGEDSSLMGTSIRSVEDS